MNRNQGMIIIALFFVVGTAALLIFPRAHVATEAPPPLVVSPNGSTEQPTATSTPFEALVLEAKAVAVLDLEHDTFLYRKKADEPLALASLTKIMTALVADEKRKGEQDVVILARHLEEEGDSGLVAGERWRLRDLIDFTLLTSSNDGARALAGIGVATQESAPLSVSEHGALAAVPNSGFSGARDPDRDFIDAMNSKAKELGLKSMSFFNPTGLDTADRLGGGYGSAADVTHLLDHAITSSPQTLEATRYGNLTFTSLDAITRHAVNTNVLTNTIPGLVASKTGYTTLAGGNLAIVVDAGFARPIAIVVLGSSQNGRFSDMQKLVRATTEYLQSTDL